MMSKFDFCSFFCVIDRELIVRSMETNIREINTVVCKLLSTKKQDTSIYRHKLTHRCVFTNDRLAHFITDLSTFSASKQNIFYCKFKKF